MARRSQPHRITWPLTQSKVQNIDMMFQQLFDDTNNGRLEVDASQLTSGVLLPPVGGTGLSSFVVGDLLYASATTTLSRLADVATGNALISGGVSVAPSWGKIGLATHVSGVLGASNGGTGQSTYAVGDLLYASTTSALSKLADVAAGAYLRSGGVNTAPVWSTLLLPNAATTGDLIQATATNSMAVLAAVSAGSYLRSGGVSTASVWSTVKIPNTSSVGDLWQGTTSSNNIAALASVAAGSYLRSAGVTTANVWSTLTLPNASAQGDLFYSTAANAMTVLNKNTTATRYLSNTGTNNDPAWAQVNLTNGVTGILPVANGGTGVDNTTQSYTATATAVANLDAVTSYTAQYFRVGNDVTVSGKFDADPAVAATLTQLRIALPIASNLAAEEQLGGVAFSSAFAGEGARIYADATNDAALVEWTTSSTGNNSYSFIFMYRVI